VAAVARSVSTAPILTALTMIVAAKVAVVFPLPLQTFPARIGR
jgi:hypothetical protein